MIIELWQKQWHQGYYWQKHEKINQNELERNLKWSIKLLNHDRSVFYKSKEYINGLKMIVSIAECHIGTYLTHVHDVCWAMM